MESSADKLLGIGHTDRSGFEGPWTFSPTTMTNDCEPVSLPRLEIDPGGSLLTRPHPCSDYKLLLNEKWNLRKWKGPIQYEDVKTKSLMMVRTRGCSRASSIRRDAIPLTLVSSSSPPTTPS